MDKREFAMASMHHLNRLIDLALEEDIGTGDITTESLIPPDAEGQAKIVAKEALVLAGLAVARAVFLRLDPSLSFDAPHADGASLPPGACLLNVSGRLAPLLTGERTALNFLQRLSGIATHVRRFVDAMPAAAIRLVDTRKTTPGWRALEKYAVRIGGAANHRMSLSDGILIKDNHVAVCGGIGAALEKARRSAPHTLKLEIEVATPAEAEEAAAAGADIIMLDNMGPETIREAVRRIDGRALVEVSGGVTRANLSTLVASGVDIVSSGALTHSAVAVDISMTIVNAP
jgi:nicotinate-nucleotide pyrophosphorylase (carboxylating)